MVEKVRCIGGWMRSVVVWRRSSKSKRRWKDDVKVVVGKADVAWLSDLSIEAYVRSTPYLNTLTRRAEQKGRPLIVVGTIKSFRRQTF